MSYICDVNVYTDNSKKYSIEFCETNTEIIHIRKIIKSVIIKERCE